MKYIYYLTKHALLMITRKITQKKVNTDWKFIDLWRWYFWHPYTM